MKRIILFPCDQPV